jgi:hypothetical protein
MPPHEADGARASQAYAPCAARDGPFDPGAARRLRLKGRRRFPLPGRLEGLIWPLGPEGACPPGRTLVGL